MDRTSVTIDASGKKLGRVASEIARILRGKDKATFAPHKDEGASVVVVHVEDIEFARNKQQAKTYWRHSQHLGGITLSNAEKLWKENKPEVLRRAVRGMLPANRLRARMLKRLRIITPKG